MLNVTNFTQAFSELTTFAWQSFNAIDAYDASPLIIEAIALGIITTAAIGIGYKKYREYCLEQWQWNVIRSVRNSDPESLKKLLKEGRDINFDIKKDDFYIYPPLFFARDLECAKLLIESGAKVNQYFQNILPLDFAIINNNLDFAKLLLQSGAIVNTKNAFGFNPLAFACQRGHLDLVQLIIDKGRLETMGKSLHHLHQDSQYSGKSNHIKSRFINWLNVQDCLGKTPLHRAIDTTLDPLGKEGLKIIDLLLESGADVNIASHQGRNSLYYAAEVGNKQIIQRLFQFGAQRLPDQDGNLPALPS